ncbi:hypothetical protein F5050DRAFT_1580780 [Lentinula boryana]|uniref:DUF6593 domain-containing protein n=1 Tax=Lentinula boryana TaxID=40481 RepID=A0ABQ8Q258_9AGAR|nr:hypothetical protein F5050DRAFT_1580780 [Lentinula boryana]
MSLNLYQRHRNFEPIMNNTYEDDNGIAVYTVHTPFALSPHRTTTISRAFHDLPSSRASSTPVLARRITVAVDEHRVSLSDSYRENRTSDDDHAAESLPSIVISDDQRLRDNDHRNSPTASPNNVPSIPPMPRRRTVDHNFIYVAQIDWRIFRSSKIRFGTGLRSGREILVKDLFKKEGWGFWGRNRVFIGDDGEEYRWNFGRTHPQLISNNTSKTLIATFHQERLFLKPNRAYLEILPPGQHMVDEIFVTFMYVERLRKAKERSIRN